MEFSGVGAKESMRKFQESISWLKKGGEISTPGGGGVIKSKNHAEFPWGLFLALEF